MSHQQNKFVFKKFHQIDALRNKAEDPERFRHEQPECYADEECIMVRS